MVPSVSTYSGSDASYFFGSSESSEEEDSQKDVKLDKIDPKIIAEVKEQLRIQILEESRNGPQHQFFPPHYGNHYNVPSLGNHPHVYTGSPYHPHQFHHQPPQNINGGQHRPFSTTN
eukprot:14896902-Ditylum_brightwellii.AAC.1